MSLGLPKIVSPQEWQIAHDKLLAWEESPERWPQTQPYEWWRPHDSYDAQPPEQARGDR